MTPGDADADSDGIPDQWEEFGIDMDCDGVVSTEEANESGGLELAVGVRDILVEVDWMGTDGTHDHAFEPEDFEAVAASFDEQALFPEDLPYLLHVDVSDELPHQHVVAWRFAPTSVLCTDWTSVAHLKTNPAWFAPWRHGIFHYGVLAHQFAYCGNGTTGNAELGGDDFIVTLGSNANVRPPISRQSTFQHEMGHNFRFFHGGYVLLPDNSVNHPSSMSYRFQFSGLLLDELDPGVPDYSHQRLDDLYESAVDELSAVGFDPLDGPPYLIEWGPSAGGPTSDPDAARAGVSIRSAQ